MIILKWVAIAVGVVVLLAACVKQSVRVDSPSGYVCTDDTKTIIFSKVECKEAGLKPIENES